MRKNHPLKKIMERLNQFDLEDKERMDILCFLKHTHEMEWLNTTKGIKEWQRELLRLAKV